MDWVPIIPLRNDSEKMVDFDLNFCTSTFRREMHIIRYSRSP